MNKNKVVFSTINKFEKSGAIIAFITLGFVGTEVAMGLH